jgi:hypothetical protein
MKNIKLILVSLYCAINSFSFALNKKEELSDIHPKLLNYCNALSKEFVNIALERKAELKDIAGFIIEQRKEHKPANLLFVCTSNSRRSHMAQVWAQVASYYYGVDSVFAFSGGTEQTRVNMNAIDALSRTGIEIYSNSQGDNPLRYLRIGEKINPWVIFSKKYTDSTNPKSNFAAIMVCTEADKACPFVEGADTRIGMPYQDPKEFDNTPLKETKYDERCRQIAVEMFFMMDLVSKTIH